MTKTIRIPLFCSLHGQYSLIVAEIHGDRLRLTGSERLPSGNGGGGAMSPPAGLGSFHTDGSGWQGCALCGARNAPAYNLTGWVWWCSCRKCNGLFHCTGNQAGQFRQACGGFTDMKSLVNHNSAPVQGWRDVVLPPASPPVLRSFGVGGGWRNAPYPAAPKQIAAPPSSLLQIGFRGKR
jgi:hypothetical protein